MPKQPTSLKEITAALQDHGWEITKFNILQPGRIRCLIKRHNEVFEGEGTTKSDAAQRAYERAGLGVYAFNRTETP